VRAGAFRADLYERLRVFEIPLPPLRERPGDVALLARHFVARLGRSEGSPPTLSPDALAALEAHSFPGNVRELRNAIERAMVMADGVIERHHLPPDLLPARVSPSAPDLGGLEQLEDIVRAHILRVYERHNRNVTRAAVALGLSRFALRTRLQSYGVLQKKDALATI